MADIEPGQAQGFKDKAGNVWRIEKNGARYSASITAPAYGHAGGWNGIASTTLEAVRELADDMADEWAETGGKKPLTARIFGDVTSPAPKTIKDATKNATDKMTGNGGAVLLVILLLLALTSKKGR